MDSGGASRKPERNSEDWRSDISWPPLVQVKPHRPRHPASGIHVTTDAETNGLYREEHDTPKILTPATLAR